MERFEFRPWQTEALNRILDEPRVALFMEMRLGKTPVIIRWAAHRTREIARPLILVVAPGNVLDDWQTELERERQGPVTRLDGIPVKSRMESVWATWGWCLINKEGLWRNTEMGEIEWDVIIVDESTCIRNPSINLTKALLRSYGHVPNRAILTGDPRPESELDYFCQMQFLHGHFMGFHNYWAFREKRFIQDPRFNWNWTPMPGLRDEIKAYVHQHAVVMTAKGVGMGNEIVMKTRHVERNDRQRRAMAQILKDFQFEYIETQFATVRDIWLARIAGGFSPDKENPELLSSAKADGIVELMTGEMRRESSVIWFRFNEELEYVVGRLNKAKIKTIGIHGGVPKDDRRHIRDRFQDGTYQVICVQTKLGRMGWNLSRASVAQYYSNWYDYETRAQSMKRIEHMTKRHPLLYIDWVTKDSIDQEVVYLLKEKRMNSRLFMRELNSRVMDSLRRSYGIQDQTQGSTNQKENRLTKVRRRYPGQD
jgi:hypothetical protein